MKIFRHLPNLFTAFNLLAGSIGIVAVFNDRIDQAATMIIIGAAFDFLDGFLARALKVRSALGKQLDSLADMITFGLLPSFLYLHLLSQVSEGFYPYFALIMAVASAFRLGRFNIDERQTDHFIGLPTPANAFLTAGLVFIYLENWESFSLLFLVPEYLAVVIIIQSFLLNSGLSFFSLKFREYQWKGNGIKYITLSAGLLFLVFLGLPGLFLTITTYILLSIINFFMRRKLSDK